MYLRLKWITIAGVLTFALMQGCSSPTSNDEPRSGVPASEQLILGKKLNDPYTIESMKAALLSLVNQNSLGLAKRSQAYSDSIEIKPNYLYVRFLPYGRLQEGLLQNWDTALVMFPFPLDQEVIQTGTDPSLPDSVKAYYAAVPVGYAFCDSVKYEILKELFLIEPVRDSIDTLVSLSKRSNVPSAPFIGVLATYGISPQELDMEALRLTDNLAARITDEEKSKMGLSKTSKAAAWFGSGYRPTGNVTYEDNILGRVPVVGARVTSGYWYTWTSVKTDAAGNFRSGSTYTWGVDYHLHFDAEDFVFQKNGMIEGPHGVKSAWNSYNTGKWGAVCACFAGAYQYYYGDMEGLCRPHQNKWYNVKLDLEMKDEDGDNYGEASVIPFLSQSISIWLKSGGSYRPSNALYGTTIHELGHNAHYQNFETRHPAIPRDFEFFSYISSDVKETFTRGVQWRFHNRRYPTVSDANAPFSYFKTDKGIRYTGLVQDLVDNNTTYAQRDYLGQNLDLVQGFTMKQIENCLFKSFGYGEFTNKLKTTYPSGSSTGLSYSITDFDNLCTYWGNI